MRCNNCGVTIFIKRDREYPEGQLSHKEAQIFAFVIQGAKNREIAEKLSVTVGTVKFHITNIFKKLGVTRRRQEALILWYSKGFRPEAVVLVHQFLPNQTGIQIPMKGADHE